jgi:hypothetical protein
LADPESRLGQFAHGMTGTAAIGGAKEGIILSLSKDLCVPSY